jgi:hypothetical protein
VLANRQFPIGHPEVITCEFEGIENYFGFVSCKVLPPKHLYLPVLPISIDGKLMFPLCKTCAKDQFNGICPHNDEDRSFTGTFVTWELFKACEKGYEILEIYEILHYPQQSSDLFKGYIKTWLKIKTESSGWPKDKVNEEQHQQWIQEFYDREGTKLNLYVFDVFINKMTLFLRYSIRI